MFMGILPDVYLCMMYHCVPSVHEGQKKALDSPQLELQLSHHVGAGLEHWSSGRAAIVFNCWDITPAPISETSSF